MRGRLIAAIAKRAMALTPVLVGATALVLALSVTGDAAVAGLGAQDLQAAAGQWLSTATDHIGRALQLGLEREPAAMAAFAAAAVVPALAMIVGMTRSMRRLAVRPRRATSIPAIRTLPPPSGRAAWIEVAGARTPRLAIGELMRIGSSEDCELALQANGLADTHLVIRRNESQRFVLIDLSADAVGGVTINGERQRLGLLTDGDLIELGPCRMVFRQGEWTGPASRALAG